MRGFTLLEVIIFVGVFSGMALVFLTVLVVITRIQVREGAVAEVNQQSHFVLRTIQDAVERSSVVDMTTDSASSTLKLRMATSSADPTYVYLSGSTVYIKETDAGTPIALTSDKVNVSSLAFAKRSHSGARDMVSVSFALSYNTQNIQQMVTRALVSGIERVNAAVFDSNVVPNTTNTYKLGASGSTWQSINDVIYFTGTNVGVGAIAPTQKLEVNGGVRLNPSGGKPACNASARGTLWLTAGTPDLLEVCMVNASSSYVWTTIN